MEELGGLEEGEAVGDKRGTATQAMNEPGATCVHHPPALSSPHMESNRNISCWFALLLSAVVGCVTTTVAASCGVNLSQHNENQVCD